jgi:Na+-transporting NADH:ubiquinone oxidoreductase subunit NqrB
VITWDSLEHAYRNKLAWCSIAKALQYSEVYTVDKHNKTLVYTADYTVDTADYIADAVDLSTVEILGKITQNQ